MKIAELYAALNGMQGFSGKVAFHDFPTPPPLPYIVYLTPSSSPFCADDRVYINNQRVNIELYTAQKSTSDEVVVENTLDALSLPYQKSESFIEDDNIYMTLYEIEL